MPWNSHPTATVRDDNVRARGPKPTPTADRLSARSARASNGCLLWTGRVDRDGYGRMTLGQTSSGNPRPALVHRVAFELSHGGIAPGMTVDHTCRNDDISCHGGSECVHRRCIEPSHLEAVTHRENCARRDARRSAA